MRQAIRTLLKHRGFTAVAILSLALAIALNTTMYSVLDALVNPRTDIRQPEQLYSLQYYGDRQHRIDAATLNAMLRSGGRTYQALTFSGGWAFYHALIEYGAVDQRADIAMVAPDYFAVLGVKPVAGRFFTRGDWASAEHPIVLSARLSRHLFTDHDAAIGKEIFVDGNRFRVIGVREGEHLSQVSGWVPPPPDRPLESYGLSIMRLRPGMTQPDAERELATIGDRVAMAVGENKFDNRFLMRPLGQAQLHLNNFHYALIGAVIAVLLVGCANLANLQLARGIARGREMATRAALGATRGDLIRHLMLEASLLGGAGLIGGLVLTYWGMRVIVASIPDTIGDYLVEPQTSWGMFAFAIGVSLVCLVLIGLFPAVRVSRVNLHELIKSGAGTGSLRGGRRQYGMLLVAEIGFALVLACGASLLIRSARQISWNVGFDSASLITGMIFNKDAPHTVRSFNGLSLEFRARVQRIKDVADGSLTIGRKDPDGEVSATDPVGTLRVAPAPNWGPLIVSPAYFRTYGVGMLHGRDFRDGETGTVAIVDPWTARALWPNTPAVGQQIKFGSPGTPGAWYTVIGVRAPMGTPGKPPDDTIRPPPAGTTRPTKNGAHYLIGGHERSVYTVASVPGSVYVPVSIEDSVQSSKYGWSLMSFVVRARRTPRRAAVALRQTFSGDARLRISWAETLDDASGATMERANHDFVAAMFTLFALLALALAALGVYAIVAHSVEERRREIGVRLALGSTDAGVLHVVLREGNVFALGGIALGLLLTRYGTGWLRAFLWVPSVDPYSIELFIPVALFLFAVAVVAAVIPASRATRIDPVESLRCE